jgi:hypothetical protein
MPKVLIEKELGATPTITESEVVDILVQNGVVKKHVLFLRPNRVAGSKTPDIQIDHAIKWEIKSITKDGKYTLEHSLRLGLSQSKNLVIDIRKLSGQVQLKYSHRIEAEYLKRKSWLGAIIVLRNHKANGILTLKK